MVNKKFLKTRFKDDRRGVSAVIATVLLIGLTVFAVAIVWGIINTFIGDEIDRGDACFGIFGEVSIHDPFTCYNGSSNELEFSIRVGDIEVEEILVRISGNESSVNFKLTEEGSEIDNLEMYDRNNTVVSPGKNSILTYRFNIDNSGIKEERLRSMEIAPLIDGVQCETSDSKSNFASCT